MKQSKSGGLQLFCLLDKFHIHGKLAGKEWLHIATLTEDYDQQYISATRLKQLEESDLSTSKWEEMIYQPPSFRSLELADINSSIIQGTGVTGAWLGPELKLEMITPEITELKRTDLPTSIVQLELEMENYRRERQSMLPRLSIDDGVERLESMLKLIEFVDGNIKKEHLREIRNSVSDINESVFHIQIGIGKHQRRQFTRL